MPILNTSIALTTQAIILKMLMKEVDQGVNVFRHCFPMLGNSSTSLGRLLNQHPKFSS